MSRQHWQVLIHLQIIDGMGNVNPHVFPEAVTTCFDPNGFFGLANEATRKVRSGIQPIHSDSCSTTLKLCMLSKKCMHAHAYELIHTS
jgi:hypothetical protein